MAPEPTSRSSFGIAERRLLHLLERGGRLPVAIARSVESSVAEQGTSVIDAVIASGTLTDAEVANVIAEDLHLPLVDLETLPPMDGGAKLVDESTAKHYALVPVRMTGGNLVVAMANPLDDEALKRIEFSTGLGIRPVVASREQIFTAIQRLYGDGSVLDSVLAIAGPGTGLEILSATQGNDQAVDVAAVTRQAEQPPIVKIVNLIVLQALQTRASDIHVEPAPGAVVVRYRIDGLLQEVLRLPKWVQASVIARIKIMASLDITEHRRPQDGRIAIRSGEKTIDLRVSSMPTAYGEKIVLRLLDPEQGIHRLGDLGLGTTGLATVRRIAERPEGMILVTGPTGSGKTTTLYAMIQEVASPELNITTIENPIEYQLPGAAQIPVNEKQGLTFATVLRSVLRQDPDVIFVGEIRDDETAEIAFQAAQTGHLVLSTVHTNDAAATVTRLLELGVEPHVLGPSLLCVIAQRLVRRICPECSEPRPHVPQEDELLGIPPDAGLRRGQGCPACHQTGFRGRIGCYEVLEVTPGIERLIAEGAPESSIRALAEEQGTTSVLDDARRKILDGITTPEEVLRVVELDTKRRLICPECRNTIEEQFVVCPFCRTRLRPVCPSCGKMLKAKWQACPYCGTAVDDPKDARSG